MAGVVTVAVGDELQRDRHCLVVVGEEKEIQETIHYIALVAF